ncbi:3-dehydroquinate synthase [Pradoshia sp. D12]|uniref:3-dehydroquinate synthase n=1 Tax=Bacillaceae TaxID=186817 RepID=UPI0011274500|nr:MULTISPECIES: 3-dehydroquinate synthase [Bacillaceae]QFK71806.1 3-dehydroquinate synthase [Pradoshia sp. D12]TPF73601.1 3-dehydroquinate synthase [Bacillus sp. D12]
METIQIKTSSKEYPIFIGDGVIEELPIFLEKNFKGKPKVYMISDELVSSLYSELIETLLAKRGYEVIIHAVPTGERAKSFSVYEECLTVGFENKLDRDSLVLALGGGVVGDLAGFVAATYMRGIPYIQLPTTLLAHDSAVGGKVAINHQLGKNLVGCFYQPEAVFYDSSFLSTLPEKEWRSGFAELIKHALLCSKSFYDDLRNQYCSISDLQSKSLASYIKKGISVKATIVSEDEKEKGSRAFLNFGHTLAHAIEGAAGYGVVTHGEAVAFGMLFDLYLSQKYADFSFNLTAFKDWLTNLGYLQIPKEILSAELLLPFMKLDKKNKQGTIATVLLNDYGRPALHSYSDTEIQDELTYFLNNIVGREKGYSL